MDTARTVWPTVARTDEWAGGWIDGYILEPVRAQKTTIRQLRGTVPGYSNCTSTDEARQDETSVLGPSRLLAGWVWCRHLRDVIWGGTWQVAAPQAGSSGISIVLCGWLPCPGQVPRPWNWTWALENGGRVGER